MINNNPHVIATLTRYHLDDLRRDAEAHLLRSGPRRPALRARPRPRWAARRQQVPAGRRVTPACTPGP